MLGGTRDGVAGRRVMTAPCGGMPQFAQIFVGLRPADYHACNHTNAYGKSKVPPVARHQRGCHLPTDHGFDGALNPR